MSDETGGLSQRMRSRLRADNPGFHGLADEPLPQLQGAVITLAAVTGFFHLVVGIRYVSNAIGTNFAFYLGISVGLAGVAFLVAAVLAGVGIGRDLLYRLGIPFTTLQIVVWYVLNRPITASDTLGIVDKTVQAALVVCLIVLVRAR